MYLCDCVFVHDCVLVWGCELCMCESMSGCVDVVTSVQAACNGN